jgi:hypothetical protein
MVWRFGKVEAAKLFTGAALALQKSGTGILPVITGHHRQDADAT